ncbi:DUF5686 and carboxypeptidase regulatory-like domain-containing protein [Microscilla marina]|uniref:Carboxypeptidase-like regulatory domain-containing protein n=1 Tax=Microscilla marina ATCC 23134 TaxID=313606 RepID=A1ZGX0_MICM2|nr:DUF5686 and carboxypeptidase regulatory-like domain-containing protein [Microscilla marina]EAY30239.1 hypothetical protein M23134_08061 [Microscilla marina ATCC 23134]
MKNQLLLKTLGILLLVILWVLPGRLTAQQKFTLKGRVTDKKGQGLPFATVYVKGTSNGTTTNDNGDYFLPLKAGSHEIAFQFIGYKASTKKVTINQSQTLNVSLEPEVLTLNEVTITSNGEDPAYPIMRKAIRNRKKHLREIEKFTCDAYVKGLQRLGKAPKRVLGMKVDVDTGIVYFSESVSELSYKNGEYKEKMISSKVSGNSRGFSFNQASEMETELYNNIIDNTGFSERGMVSPVAFNAMLYYRYRYEGSFQENGLTVNKIRLMPRRKLAPAFSGFIYIIDDTWRIHSIELSLGKGTIDFIDSVTIKQVYAPVGNGKVWRPLSVKYNFEFAAFGFKGHGYFLCMYSNYNITPTFQRRFFNNEVMTVTNDANKKDSTYWSKIRPIPLTTTEVKDYREKDSLQVIKDSKPYKDSVDAKRNKLGITGILYGGYTYRNSYRRERFSFQPLISTFQYNTVEGLVTDLSLNYQKRYENRTYFTIDPSFRYGFSNKRFQAKLRTSYRFAPKSFGTVWAEGGRYVEQLSRMQSISPFLNSYYTLVVEENFMKIYEKAYAKVGYRQELINGLYFKGSLEFAERNAMQNTTNYSWRNVENREFTPNAPVNNELANTDFAYHQALTFNASLRLRIKQRYITYPHRKFIVGSDYPTLLLGYRKGLAIGDSDVDYDLLHASISDEISMGVIGASKYRVSAGVFLNTNKMYFMDFRHFSGNQTGLLKGSSNAFQLLEYYRYSTQDRYLEGHYEHHFNGFVMNGFPLINKLKSQLVISANYLWTPTSLNYLELGIGLEHILKIMRFDFIVGLQEGNQVSSGFRFGFGF